MRALVVSAVLLGACSASKASTPRSSVERKDGIAEAALVDAGAIRACAFDAKDLAPCFEECDRAVALSCRIAAERLERGEGIAHDPSRALHLHERACELREASGCSSAARGYGRGIGVRADRPRQLELLARACMLGDGLSCGMPARAFARGEPAYGVAADPRRATTLRERACLAGIEEACEALADAGL